MKNTGGINLLFAAALALIILAGTGAAVSLSNSGGGTWKYQREISVKENSGTTLTDYQVLIELKGVDFPDKAQNSGADVRFMDSNGKELNYWIENWDYSGKSAKVWVKVPSIPMSTTIVIQMYYGNAGAISASNGDKVFEFFDDFFGASLNTTNKWNIIQNQGTIEVTNGYLRLYRPPDTQIDITSKNLFTGYMTIEYREKILRSDYYFNSVYYGSGSSYSSIGYSFWPRYESALYTGGRKYPPRSSGVESSDGDVVINPPINTWFSEKFTISSGNIARLLDGVTSETATRYSGVSSGNIGIYASSASITAGSTAAMESQIDLIRVRKYTSSEPTMTLAPPKSSSLSITKSSSPYSLRQFQESTIKVLIENSGTSEVKSIEIMDSIHPSFDLTGGDFPNPKKFDTIRAGESRELQYTIRSKESGAFTLDPATVTYADSEGNIQEVKSEPVSIKVIPSSDGGGSGTNTGQNSKSASVSLHGEKTDVVMGEDILLRLSAVNLITKPRMHVQVIIIPPSGMSVTSSEFSKSAAGQFTANYQLEPGDGKDIEVRIRSNQIGDFNVNGRIIYYFGDDKDKSEDQTLNLPIKVRKEIASTQEAAGKSTPGFEGVIGISGLLIVMGLLKRGGLSK